MPSDFHVVHIIPRLVYGGAERFVVDLSNHLAKRGVRQTIVTFFDDNPLADDLSSQVKLVVVPKISRINPRYIWNLRRLLKEIQPDIIHTHLGGDIWGRLAAWKLGVPIVTTEHSVYAGEGSSWYIRFMKRGLRSLSSVYVCPSEAVRDALTTEFGVARERQVVIPHGIALKRFHLPMIQPEIPLRFGMVGRLAREKGHNVALQALGALRSENWHLTIVGEGKEQGRLEQFVQSLGIANRVTWLPFTPDVSRVLQQMDVVLVPSLWEGLGIGIMEAMAAGRVVIASRVGGIPELIQDQETGVLVSVGDVDAWQKAIKACLTDPDALIPMAKNAEDYAREHFSVDKMVGEYEKVYRELLSN